MERAATAGRWPARVLAGLFGSICLGLSVLGVGASAKAAESGDCDRACLKAIADEYFVALEKHDPSLLPLAAKVKFTENNAVLKLGEGHWKAGGKESFRMEIFDPEQGGIGVEAVIPSATGPAPMLLRLKVENRRITEIESIVVYKEGKDYFGAPQNLAGTKPSFYWTRTIRPSERDSRYQLVATTEGYWRAFETEGTPQYVRAALLPDTVRLENGVQTTLADVSGPNGFVKAATAAEAFDLGVFKGMKIADRRYPVVDEEVGATLSMARFGDKPDAGVVGEFFAVNQGRIMQIHSIWRAPATPGPTPW